MYTAHLARPTPMPSREPPATLVHDLAAYRIKRERRELWLAGRRSADADSWRLYEKRHRVPPKPIHHDYDGAA